MTSDDTTAVFFERLRGRLGTPVPSEAEVDLVLHLAKVVADASERRHAPVTAYLAGLTIPMDAADREEQLRDLVARLVSLDPTDGLA